MRTITVDELAERVGKDNSVVLGIRDMEAAVAKVAPGRPLPLEITVDEDGEVYLKADPEFSKIWNELGAEDSSAEAAEVGRTLGKLRGRRRRK